jgi:hypothetical protein
VNPVIPWIDTCFLRSKNSGKFYESTVDYKWLKGGHTG